MSERTAVGYHVDDGVLREARIRRSGRLLEVVLSQRPTRKDPSGAAGNGDDELPSLFEHADVDPRVASLPAHAVMGRLWSFPKADDRTMRQMIAHRLEAESPVPIDQLVWAYRRGPHRGADGSLAVFVQASRCEQVSRHMAWLAGEGLAVEILTTEAEAIQALYRYAIKRAVRDELEALVLAVPRAWLVAVLADGLVQSVRRVSVQAEQPTLAARECCQAIEAQVDRRSLQRIHWCGPADLDEARAWLGEHAKVPVETVEVAENLATGDGQRLEADQLACHGLAIGLALAGLLERDDVIRLAGTDPVQASATQDRLQRALSQPKRWAILAAALTLLAIVLHVGLMRWENGRMRTILAAADQAAAANPELQAKLRAMQRLQTYRIDVEKVVGDLGQVLPDPVVITSLQFSRDHRLVIKGTAKDPKEIFTFADALRKSSRFREVNPERAEPAQGGSFTITAEVVGMNPLNQNERGGTWR